jgi:hypothetical protein
MKLLNASKYWFLMPLLMVSILKTSALHWRHCPMTDHKPNDLSHLSDAKFHSLCPQGEHAPGPEPLSPAAQAVLDAACNALDQRGYISDQVTATLRAVADQLVPHPGRYPMNEYMEGIRDCKQDFYAALRGIADELEGHDLP